MITHKVDVSSLTQSLPQVPSAMRRAGKVATRAQARLYVRNNTDGGILGITPPASAGRVNISARKQGESSIRRDLLGGKGGGKALAGIFTVLPDSLIAQAEVYPNSGNVRLFVTKSGEIYGTEKALFRPFATLDQMYDHHHRYWKNGRMSQAGGRTRDIGRWKFIDKMVVGQRAMDAYLKYVYEKVGITASSFVPAALESGATVPPWINRHGGSAGYIRTVDTLQVFFYEIGCRLPWADDIGMQRRMDQVLVYRKNAFKRRLPYIIRAELKKTLQFSVVVF